LLFQRVAINKKNGEKRFCFDARKLNEITKHDSYPLPRVDRILSLLRDAKFISSIDLRKAFWQIPLHPEAKEKTTFAIPGRGLFQFKVVPFGLCNSTPEHFPQWKIEDNLLYKHAPLQVPLQTNFTEWKYQKKNVKK
jgi:hypothetical protein